MNREKSSGKSMSFSWVPKAYPVRWAESPDEVPPWDVSRDFPKEVGDGYKRHLEGDPYEVSSLRPFLRDHVDYVDRVETWEPTPAPKSGYPRLVRESVKMMPLPRPYRHDDDVVSMLAPLTEYIQSWRAKKPVKVLRRKLLELAERYGSPVEAEQNTLVSWLKLVVFVDVHLRAMREFKLYGLKSMLGVLENRRTELQNLRIVDEAATHRSQRRAREKHDINKRPFSMPSPVMLQDLDELEQIEWWQTEQLLSSARTASKETDSAQAFRNAVADKLFYLFSASVTEPGWDYAIIPTPEGFIVQCPIKAWAAFKLSELWRYGAPVEACPVCGTLFARSHGNQMYCRRGTCAGKVSESKRKPRKPIQKAHST